MSVLPVPPIARLRRRWLFLGQGFHEDNTWLGSSYTPAQTLRNREGTRRKVRAVFATNVGFASTTYEWNNNVLRGHQNDATGLLSLAQRSMRLLDSFKHELADCRILAKNTDGKQRVSHWQKRHSHKISGLVIHCCHLDKKTNKTKKKTKKKKKKKKNPLRFND